MRVKVSDDCLGCGLCAYAVPEVFKISDMVKSVPIETDIPTELEEKVIAVRNNCPVHAIRTYTGRESSHFRDPE